MDEQVASTERPSRRSGSQKRRRSRSWRVACDAGEAAAIEAAAALAGLTPSAFLRRQALGTPGPRAVRPPHPDRAALARVLAAVGMLGSNVNQLARHANTTGELAATATLEQTRDVVLEIRDELMRALGRGC